MSQPVWITNAGSLGTYSSGSKINIQLHGYYLYPATEIKFKLLSGDLPNTDTGNLTISKSGLISGTTSLLTADTTNTFTVRMIDNLGQISDRTFSLTITAAFTPQFFTNSGPIFETDDSIWIEFPILYSAPIDPNSIEIAISSGKLPPGLEIDRLGVIRGYANPPEYPYSKTYNFTLTYKNDLGMVTNNYSILVKNHDLRNSPNTRRPVILNSKPLSYTIDPSDIYYGYYLNNKNQIPTIKSGEYFTFKVIGHDFDSVEINYQFFDLPLGLAGDVNTGWITGTPVVNSRGINRYTFTVRVTKRDEVLLSGTKISLVSEPITYTLTVTNDVDENIIWMTPSNLGTVYNNTISNLYVEAIGTDMDLLYKLDSGILPPNLTLLTNGDITGRIADQPSTEAKNLGEKTIFDFTIVAYSPDYPIITSKRKFSLTVEQFFTTPTENLYLKATPSLEHRDILKSLLTNTHLIPNEDVYRLNSNYFGKATDVSFVHAYGINASTIEQYVASITKNHYWRNITLGEIKTARATDDNGNVIYEVVYSQVIDNLQNTNNVSIPSEISWPKYVNFNLGPWITSTEEVFTSFADMDNNGTLDDFTSLSPGVGRKLYPASLTNMGIRIADNLGQNFHYKLLPRWMTSQQENGDILGFVDAWVICYTKPKKSTTIATNIKTQWGNKLNKINFRIDRYTVDKSATYNYNSYLSIPAWNEFPSASPEPDPLDSHDFYVLFPKKTILPK